MKSLKLFLGCLVLSSVLFCARGYAEGAKAELKTPEGGFVGDATLSEVPGGVKISLKIANLTPGLHAFHIHWVGKCEPPDFASAGPHFNPAGKKHGHKNPAGAHAGDLQNILVGTERIGSAEVIAEGVTLGPGANSLFPEAGTSLVIHAGSDDELTDPSGNSGARIACGVITK